MKYKVSYFKYNNNGWVKQIIEPKKRYLSYSKAVKLAKKIKKKRGNGASSLHIMYINNGQVIKYELIIE